jgi:ABC-type Na+ efflux pump permease subunit
MKKGITVLLVAAILIGLILLGLGGYMHLRLNNARALLAMPIRIIDQYIVLRPWLLAAGGILTVGGILMSIVISRRSRVK